MSRYAIVVDGKTVDYLTSEDAETAAREYSAKMGPDSDFGFVRGVKMLDANTGGSRWAIIKTDGGDITARHTARLGFTRKVSYKTGRDRNGNKIVHCSSRKGGFTIQTKGNLPRTHRDGVTAETDAEVCAYVAAHGTMRQKRILGI
jgi:hypothetical protein